MSFSIRSHIVEIACAFKWDRIVEILLNLASRARLRRVEKVTSQVINFYPQGSGDVIIVGNPLDFEIDPTSHLKSNTFIECSGGVSIGRYFHTGRGLTIFSTNHNWRSEVQIPYDPLEVKRPVKIGDAVWFGTNVTVAPGAQIGDGVIVAAGAVVFGTIEPCAIVRGNPATVIGYRDRALFERLFQEGRFN